MPAAIRLMRVGKKKYPSYRIIVIDQRKKRGGRYIDQIGYYNPMPNPPVLQLDKKKFQDWLNKGAVLSEGINKLKNLLKRV
ncbi:30S ribosomal protein S16 [Candidatus Roizmanbacteria bacterium RIFCSPHIGHO2_01_FULL_39_12c]|uniref:Small ribosomal subunit protein bS16 n=1 Tax=Candidatus Roizmanbacteria bacterium RIFCSPHIGHO2_01_FULL_39_12c TaxID=1802031 RepID=A0A1F7GDY0_9BACT|nr:MAG: 30S ribosomal protein S16 [Candidatus Roizmanbacteria bacterium RIFCSPHIGHO2_01_FULL_39_12c]OGK47517.1 MAG: 30S ribosomal protein S16 [Candidatus Roizmanbacteria bacterium RIFCSPLOWO2_01_FULL_40_13]